MKFYIGRNRVNFLIILAAFFFTVLLAPLQGFRASLGQLSLADDLQIVSLDSNLPIGDYKKDQKSQMLYKIKWSIRTRKYKKCLEQISQNRKNLSEVEIWLLAKRIFCLTKRSQQIKSTKELEKLVKKLDKSLGNLLNRAESKDLIKNYLNAYLELFKKYRYTDIKKAWELSQNLLRRKNLIQGDVASVYARISGLAKTYGKKEESIRYLEMSLKSRLSKGALREYKALTGKVYEKSNELSAVSLKISRSEEKSFKKLKKLFKRRANKSFLKSSRSFLKTYKLGENSKWVAQKLGLVYFRLESQAKIDSSDKKMVKDFSSQHLFFVAKYFYGRHRHELANNFATIVYNRIKNIKGKQKKQELVQKDFYSLLWILGNSNHYLGDYVSAFSYFKKLAKLSFLGSKKGEEWQSYREGAWFRLGLISLRQKRWLLAEKYFKKVLSQSESEEYELLASYWLWRTHQKLKYAHQNVMAEKIIQKYPLTYYGLRARAELNKGKLINFNSNPHSFKLKLNTRGMAAFRRYKLLLQSNWLKEARAEAPFVLGLQNIKKESSSKGKNGIEFVTGKTVEQKLFLARLFYLSRDYFQSILISAEIWQLEFRRVSWPQLLLSFPIDYQKVVQKQSRRNGLSPYLVLGLIKQESSFNETAVSSSGARGLMQLLTSTAHEVARWSRPKVRLVKRKIYDPRINIQLGTSYLKRLLRVFNGNVPLALASYNAGIGHIRRWANLRLETRDIEKNSDPLNELWIDELPWDETRFYVKAILRNYLIYRLQDQGDFTFSQPIWPIVGKTSL